MPRRRCGREHRYPGHTGDEINFWLPITRACGNNSLFVESSPGAGDFRPLDLEYGECFRFDGENCAHYTVANDTGQARVSLDFRVIPASLYRDDFGGRIGSYPCELSSKRGSNDTPSVEASDAELLPSVGASDADV